MPPPLLAPVIEAISPIIGVLLAAAAAIAGERVFFAEF